MNHINLTLREQLDQATITNQKLSQEIQKVNHEWVRLREQLESREREWREEENVFEQFLRLKIFCYKFIFVYLKKKKTKSRSMTTLDKSTRNCSVCGEQWLLLDARTTK